MIQIFHDNNDISWVYCNYILGNKFLKFRNFDEKELNKINYCSTMSLIQAQDFPGFTEHLKRLQDWDLFLQLSEKGKKGKWIDEYLFYAAERSGITQSTVTWNDAVKALKLLHPMLGK